LRLRDIPGCFRLILWDSDQNRLVSIPEVQATQAAA
jgi:hypothetical protein